MHRQYTSWKHVQQTETMLYDVRLVMNIKLYAIPRCIWLYLPFSYTWVVELYVCMDIYVCIFPKTCVCVCVQIIRVSRDWIDFRRCFAGPSVNRALSYWSAWPWIAISACYIRPATTNIPVKRSVILEIILY